MVIYLVSILLNYALAYSYLKRPIRWALFGVFLPVFSQIFLLIAIWNARVGKKIDSAADWSPPDAGGSASSSVISSDVVESQGRGWYNVDVVGESNYVDNIRKIARGKTESFSNATLVLEPSNRYDKNAVRVDISGLTVGYISKDEAPSYHPLLKFLNSTGTIMTFPSRMYWDGEEVGSVSLQLDEPEFVVVVNTNNLPANAVRWPKGGRVQVTKESDHSSTIGKILDLAYVEGRCAAFLELRCEEEVPGKQVVSVYFSEEKVGELSAQMGKKFWPGLVGVCSSGKPLVVSAQVVGNSLVAEIVLLMKAPVELTNVEIAALKG